MAMIRDKTYQKKIFNYVTMAMICDKTYQKIKVSYVTVAKF